MKQRFTKLPGSTHVLSLFFALILSVWGTNPAWADEITVYDGTATNSYLPLYGYYAASKGTISEFIVPSSQLTALNGMAIKQLTFYLSQPANASFGNASFNVYLEEVTGSNYDDSSGSQLTESKTLVYAGALDATGSTMEIPFTNNYTYKGGNLLIAIEVGTAGTYKAATFYGTTTTSYAGRYKYSSNTTRAKFIPKTTFITPTNGPALTVKDGSTKITSPYAFDFGLATAGTTKTFTLSNPGTAAVEGLSVSETGNFGATLSATSIAAGGEATLTITMPAATGSSAITISSSTTGIDNFVINASGTIRDANKVYLDFSDGQIPDGWTSVAIGSYASSYGSPWAASEGYVSQSGSSSSYEWAFTSPKLVFTEGEQVLFETQKYSSSTWYNPSIKVEYSTDGSTWTTIGSAFTDDTDTDWTSRSVTIPTADAKYIRFSGWYIKLRNIYGGQLPIEPKMVVTQPASLDYGIISEATAKTFTIANTGLATLEGITVTSSNSSIFAVSGAPTSLAAGKSQEVTITMAATTAGALSSDIKVSATGMEDVDFTVTGVVMPAGMPVEDFAEGLPENWTNSSWTFADGVATGKSSSAYLTTPKLIFSDGDFIVIKAKRSDSDAADYITIQGSNDNGSTWTAYSKKISGSDGLTYPDYATLVVSDIPTTVNKLRFVGYYVNVDEIAGLTYAPVLTVTTGDPAETVSTPAAKDFGECAANASVTYNFANTGAGTINITNVAITGDGAAAYSTNWTESVAAPFALTITRTYDAARAGAAQDAAVTVTTSEGAFVINVTGTDKAANAPELAVSTNAIDFGKQTADAVETITVTNNGTGSMEVNITSDSEDFVVSAASLTGIGAGESKNFTVTFKYGTSYGVKNGNITVTPTYNTEAAQTITATAKAMDPETWTEDFAGNALPTGWEADANWSFSDGVAKATYTYGSTKYYLTSPKLVVGATTDELTFDYKRSNASITIEMNKDNAGWENLVKLPTSGYATDSEWQSYTITGLEAGVYQFRFTSDDYQLDNFEGFKLKPAAAHEAEIAAKTIPATGNQYVEYTASIDVKVTGTNDEQLTVKFFIGSTQYGENMVKTVTSGSTETFEVTFTPETAASGDAYFTIESTDIAAFESDKVAVTIAAATVLDETVGLPDGLTTGTKPSVVVKYTPKSGWNTIAMPFALTSDMMTQIFGEGWKAYEFKSYDSETKSLGFNTASAFYAGYPYIVYVENAATHAEGVKLQNVNISTTSENSDSHTAVFHAKYAPITAGSISDTWYGVTNEGKIQKAGSTATMKGFRGYFTDVPAGVSASLMIVDEATGISTVIAAEQLNGEVYNLSGQKVQNAKKGLYIVNGRKVVVK